MIGDNQNKAIIHVRVLVGDTFELIAEIPAVFLPFATAFLIPHHYLGKYVKIEMNFYLIKKLQYSLYHRFNIVTDDIIK